MREYTVQYMEGQDWVRVTAIYDSFEAAVAHGADLLQDGKVVRILGRTLALRGEKLPWHTIKLSSDNKILLDNPVYGCPS